MTDKTPRARWHDRFTAVLAATGALALLSGFMVLGTAGSAQADDHGRRVVVCKYVDNQGREVFKGSITVDMNALGGTFRGTFPFTFVDDQENSIAVGFEGDVDETDCPGFQPLVTIPAAPAPVDPCGAGNATWSLPADSATVVWSIDEDGHLIATAVAGAFTDGSTTQDYGLPVETDTEACPTVTAVAPTVVAPPACGVQGSYTIPSTPGVQYLLDGQPIAPGTYAGPASGTITAVASGTVPLDNPGFSFSLRVRAAGVCDIGGIDTTDVCPNLAGDQEAVPDDRELDERGRCVVGIVAGVETERPRPRTGTGPVEGPDGSEVLPAEGVPTSVNAGFDGPVAGGGAASPVALAGQGLVGGGLMLLLAAAWMRWERRPRGAHQV